VRKTPRPYQSRGVADLRTNFRAGKRKQLLVMPTGCGKTASAAMIIEAAVAKGNRVMFLAHRKELIDQCSKTLDEFGVEHGIIKGKKHWRERPDAPVQVASVQTLIKRKRPEASVLFLDEAHRSLNATNQTLLSWYPEALSLGLTATPWRLDGRGLREMYETIVAPITTREAIAQGYLLPLRIYEPERPNLKGIRKARGDYDQRALQKRMSENPKRVGNIVENWMEYGEGQRSLCFATGVQDSLEIVRKFKDAGVAAEHLDGSMNEPQRDAILKRIATGETRIVSNVDVLVEGYDLPSLGCIMLARPTTSLTRFLQMVGRGMRIFEDQTHCVILDHAGCCHRLGDPTADRNWTLDDLKAPKSDDGPAPMLTCEECSLMRPANVWRCPQCNADDLAQMGWFEGQPLEVDGRLVERTSDPNAMRCAKCRSDNVEVSRMTDLELRVLCRECSAKSYQPDAFAVGKASEERRKTELARLAEVQQQKGFKPSWVSYKYKDIFGAFPPKAWLEPVTPTEYGDEF
jgi:DNA repair protein RadD